MKNKIFLVVQIFIGLLLTIVGLNGFFQFFPMPIGTPEIGKYMSALLDAGFVFPLVAIVQFLTGLSYITNRFTALMTIVLMPVMINAFLAHIFLDIKGIGGSLIILIVMIIILLKEKNKYKDLFIAN